MLTGAAALNVADADADYDAFGGASWPSIGFRVHRKVFVFLPLFIISSGTFIFKYIQSKTNTHSALIAYEQEKIK